MTIDYSSQGSRVGRVLAYAVGVLAVLGVGFALGHYVHLPRKMSPPPAPVVVAPAPAPVLARVAEDNTRKAFVLSYAGHEIRAHAIKNKTKQDGQSVLILVHDWTRTTDDLKTKADLVCYASPEKKGDPIARSDAQGEVSMPLIQPGVEYSLYYERKDGSYDRRMITFHVVEPGSAPVSSKH